MYVLLKQVSPGDLVELGEGRCEGTHKRANLKFRQASGRGFGATLHWCSVAMNEHSVSVIVLSLCGQTLRRDLISFLFWAQVSVLLIVAKRLTKTGEWFLFPPNRPSMLQDSACYDHSHSLRLIFSQNK